LQTANDPAMMASRISAQVSTTPPPMKKAIIAIQFLLICASLSGQPAPTPDKTVYIEKGYGKGQDYLQMSEKEKRAYAMGAMNGMIVAPLFRRS